MRCAACDSKMSDLDCSRKSPLTGQYYDLCGKCFKTIADQVDSVENTDLAKTDDNYDEGDSDGNEEDQDYPLPRASIPE